MAEKLSIACCDSDNKPIQAVVSFCYRLFGGMEVCNGETDENGVVTFEIPPVARAEFEHIQITPKSPGLWGLYSDQINEIFVLQSLPVLAEPAWWLRCLGVDARNKARGSGIKVGVVDAGFFEHPDMIHVKRLWSESPSSKAGDADDDRLLHGECVCRIIADRVPYAVSSLSVAPGVDLIFADAPSETGQIDSATAAAAIVTLARQGVDIISLSWGGPEIDESVFDAIVEANQLGVTVVAAAGNNFSEPQPVFPARLDECIGVSALGLCEWGPPQTVTHHFGLTGASDAAVGTISAVGTVYAWSAGTYGEGIDAMAPGVGIMLQRGGANSSEITGTSFAAPMVTGVLAIALSQDKHYLDLPRSIERTEYVRSVLKGMCRSVGMENSYEGNGVPILESQ
jgi:subtilisin family serine protease